MSLDEILNSASRHRIEAIIGNGARAMDDIAERSRQLDKDWEQTRARQSEELKALEEKMKAVREAGKQEQEPAKREAPKVRSLSLGAEELREAGRTERAAQQPPVRPPAPSQPAPQQPAPPPPQPEVEARPKPARTMRIGAAEDDEPRPARLVPEEQPERGKHRREPRKDSDDDLSGRTWLR